MLVAAHSELPSAADSRPGNIRVLGQLACDPRLAQAGPVVAAAGHGLCRFAAPHLERRRRDAYEVSQNLSAQGCQIGGRTADDVSLIQNAVSRTALRHAHHLAPPWAP